MQDIFLLCTFFWLNNHYQIFKMNLKFEMLCTYLDFIDFVSPFFFVFQDWEVVVKTLPDGRKKKFHRKVLTTIFSSLNEKNEMIENPPIHIEEVEIYEVSDDDDDAFSPVDWKVVDKMQPDGTFTKVRTRSSTTVITPKDTMKLEDKTVEETPISPEEIELDESSPHEHTFDPEVCFYSLF